MEKTELYETFQKGLTSVNGESYIAKKADVAATLTKIFQDKDTHEVALVETPLLKEIGAVDALKAAGIKVDTDHFRKNAPIKAALPKPIMASLTWALLSR